MSDYYQNILDSTELENQLMGYRINGELGPMLQPYYEQFTATNPVGQGQKSQEFVQYMQGIIKGMVPQPSEVPQAAGPKLPKWPFAGRKPEGSDAASIFGSAIRRISGE